MFSSRNRNIYYEPLDSAKVSLTSLRNTITIKKNIQSHYNTFSQDINSISYNISKDNDSRIYSDKFEKKDESKLSSKNSKKSYGKKDNINIDNKIKEYIKHSNYLKEKLKKNNDINQEKINKYEELNQKIIDIEVQNKVINQQFLDFKDENKRLKRENENLKKMINDINSNSKIQEERNVNNIDEKYKIIIEKENFLQKVNIDLEKSNSEYDILIDKLQKTFNILNSNSKKKQFKNLCINRLNNNFIKQNQEEKTTITNSEINLNNNNINLSNNNKNNLYQEEKRLKINPNNNNLNSNLDILKEKIENKKDILEKLEGKTSDNLNQFQQKIKNINRRPGNNINMEIIKLSDIIEKEETSKNQIEQLNNNIEENKCIYNKNKNISFEQNYNQIYNKLLKSYENIQKNIESKNVPLKNEIISEKSENFDLEIDKGISFPNKNNSLNYNLNQSQIVKTSINTNSLKQNIIDDSISSLSKNKLNNPFQIINTNIRNIEKNQKDISNSNYFNESKEKDINSSQIQFSFSRNNLENIQKKDIKNDLKKITPLNLDEKFIMDSNINNIKEVNINYNDKNSKLNDLLYSDNKDNNKRLNDEKEILSKDKINEENNKGINNNKLINISEIKRIQIEKNKEKENTNKKKMENLKEINDEKITEKHSIINENTNQENNFKIYNKEFNNLLNESPKFEQNSNYLISNSIKEKLKEDNNIIQKKIPLKRVKSNSLTSSKPSYLKILKDISNLQKKKNLKNKITIDINDITNNLTTKSIPNNNRKIFKSQSSISSKNNSFNSESENYNSQINELITLMKQKENEIEGIKEQFKILNSNLQKNHNENCNYREKYIKEKQINSKVILSLEQLNGLAQELLDTRVQMQYKYENEIKRLKNKINKNPSFSPEKDNNYLIKAENNEYIFMNNKFDNLKELVEKYNFMEIFNYEELRIENICQLNLKSNKYNDSFNCDKNIIDLNSEELNKNIKLDNGKLNEDEILEISNENDSINQKLESNKDEEMILEYISEDDECYSQNKKNNINSILENKNIDFENDSKIQNIDIFDDKNEKKNLYENIFNNSENENDENTNYDNNENYNNNHFDNKNIDINKDKIFNNLRDDIK